MANGDLAATAGIPVVPASKDIRLGYDDINALADAIAQHILNGTHTAASITAGIFATARIPNLDAGKIATGQLPVERGGTAATTALGARQNLGISATNTPSGTGSNVQADLNSLSARLTAGGL